jgi:hypothetical protein
MIAVFTTSEIFSTWQDRRKNLEHKGTFEGGHETVDIYSTGNLEKAVEQGYDVYVVSTRTKLGEHDEWWLSLVKRNNIFLVEKDENDHREALLRPWKILYKHLCIDFPTDDEHFGWQSARYLLNEDYGVKLGYQFGHEG